MLRDEIEKENSNKNKRLKTKIIKIKRIMIKSSIN